MKTQQKFGHKFGLHTRLLCGQCLRISSHHEVVEGSEEAKDGRLRVAYVCKCGNKDQDYFTDSGNFESEDTEYTSYDKLAELEKLKEKVARMEYEVERAKERWDELWETDEDVFL